MKAGGGSTAAKRAAGEHAAELVEEGDVVGLGTGSTAAHAIRAIGDAQIDVRGVPTSFQSRQLAIDCGISLVGLDEVDGLDLAIDGADQIADGALIKGGGGAHAREKIVAASAAELHIVVDPGKLSAVLDHPVPVSVLPDARPLVVARVSELGGEPTLREASHKDGPVVTDNGNLVLDCRFGEIDAPAELAAQLASIPGVVEHGLFVDVATAIHVGSADGVDVRRP